MDKRDLTLYLDGLGIFSNLSRPETEWKKKEISSF